jgi:lysophospholipid hydrolase
MRIFEDNLKHEQVNKMTDFSRLARFLTGTSIGLVLGGGGARSVRRALNSD